jgi:hypothetical protein
MVDNFADWLCNFLVWASVVALIALLYDSFVSPSFLTAALNPIGTFIAVAVIAGLSILWPKY